jgi:hypothetical protein
MKNKRLLKTAVLLIGIMLTFSMATCATAQQSADQQSAQQQAAEQQPDPSQHPPIQPAPANPEQPYTLVGSWYGVTDISSWNGTNTFIWTFNSDGTGTREERHIRNDGQIRSFRVGYMSAFRWSVSGNRLTTTILNGDSDSTSSRTYNISGNTLTLGFPGGGEYTRAQPQQAPTTNQPLPIGTWKDTNLRGDTTWTYTFNSDGTGTYRVQNSSNVVTTQNLKWSIHEDWLRLDINSGNNRNPVEVEFWHYSISGNELNMRGGQYIRQ